MRYQFFLYTILLFMTSCQEKNTSTSVSYPSIQTDEDIDRVLPTLSNWGRWGPDDQQGTLNYITPEIRAAAGRLIRKGVTVSLSQSTNIVRDSISRGAHEMNIFRKGSMDFIAMNYHGYKVTHLDGHWLTSKSHCPILNKLQVATILMRAPIRVLSTPVHF